MTHPNLTIFKYHAILEIEKIILTQTFKGSLLHVGTKIMLLRIWNDVVTDIQQLISTWISRPCWGRQTESLILTSFLGVLELYFCKDRNIYHTKP